MKRNFLLLGGIVMAGTLWAAEPAGPSISAPILGYMFDGTAKAIRAISGIPGAASLGEPVIFSSGLSDAWVHSGARVAVAITKSGALALLSWGADARTSELDSVLRTPTDVSFSRSGAFAAVSDGATVEIWSTGATPALLKRYHADAMIAAIAVNNDGDTAVAKLDGSIVRLSGDEAHAMASGGEWSALAFRGADLIAADASHNELLRLTTDGGRAVIAVLPASVHSIANMGGETFAVAHAAGLAVASSATGTVAIACDCQPRGLEELAGGAVWVRGTSLVLDPNARLTLLPNLFTGNAGGNN
jgi:hypothetical protein